MIQIHPRNNGLRLKAAPVNTDRTSSTVSDSLDESLTNGISRSNPISAALVDSVRNRVAFIAFEDDQVHSDADTDLKDELSEWPSISLADDQDANNMTLLLLIGHLCCECRAAFGRT